MGLSLFTRRLFFIGACYEIGQRNGKSGVILIGIFPGFSRIWTEYGEIRSISPYSVRMRENVGKMQTRITPNTDSFYAVTVSNMHRKYQMPHFVNSVFISKQLICTSDRFLHLRVFFS